ICGQGSGASGVAALSPSSDSRPSAAIAFLHRRHSPFLPPVALSHPIYILNVYSPPGLFPTRLPAFHRDQRSRADEKMLFPPKPLVGSIVGANYSSKPHIYFSLSAYSSSRARRPVREQPLPNLHEQRIEPSAQNSRGIENSLGPRQPSLPDKFFTEWPSSSGEQPLAAALEPGTARHHSLSSPGVHAKNPAARLVAQHLCELMVVASAQPRVAIAR
ncbi:ATP-dependent helicase, partial [Striga asiatica]